MLKNELDCLLGEDVAVDSTVGSAMESAIDSATAELDAIIGEVATEGLFTKPKTVEQLIAQVTKRAAKLKTEEACDDLLAKLKTEEGKFNDCLKGMKAAAQEFADEKITKKELAAKIKPFIKELKNSSDIITLGQIAADSNNVTDEELKTLREFIIGARKAITARKAEVKATVEPDAATESVVNAEEASIGGFISALESLDIAEEASETVVAGALIGAYTGLIVTAIIMAINDPERKAIAREKHGKTEKEIKVNIKAAKVCLKAKDFDGAVAAYKKAKVGYAEIGKQIKAMANFTMAGEIRLENGKSVAISAAKAMGINWTIQKMHQCDNAIGKIGDAKDKFEAKAAKKASKANESLDLDAAVLAFDAAIESLGLVEEDEEVTEEEEIAEEALDNIDALLLDEE